MHINKNILKLFFLYSSKLIKIYFSISIKIYKSNKKYKNKKLKKSYNNIWQATFN